MHAHPMGTRARHSGVVRANCPLHRGSDDFKTEFSDFFLKSAKVSLTTHSVSTHRIKSSAESASYSSMAPTVGDVGTQKAFCLGPL